MSVHQVRPRPITRYRVAATTLVLSLLLIGGCAAKATRSPKLPLR
jgi:hypothetical protein